MLNDFQKKDVIYAVNKDVDSQIMTNKEKPFTEKKISKMRWAAYKDYKNMMEDMNKQEIEKVKELLSETDKTPVQYNLESERDDKLTTA